MGVQVFKEEKTIEELQFEIEQELIAVDSSYFKRDKEIILEMYKELFKDTKRIPKFTEIEQQVAEFNYDVCYKVSILEFEAYYEQDALNSMMSSYGCSTAGELEQYVDISGVLTSEIDYLTGQMFNDLCSSRTKEIEEYIKEVLESLDVVYEDDTDYNPLCSEILFDRDEHMVVVNDAQLIMFPGIHADEYGYENSTIYDDYENMRNYTIKRRVRVSNSRLLKSGGD